MRRTIINCFYFLRMTPRWKVLVTLEGGGWITKNLLFTLIVPWSFGTYEILQFFPSKNAQIKEQRSTSSYIFVSEANLQHPPVRPSVRQSPFLKNLVRTTPPKRLDGLRWNLQGIFFKVSSCTPDKNFYRQSVSKSVSHQYQKILSGHLLPNDFMD